MPELTRLLDGPAVSDAPRPDEIAIFMVIADGGRLHNRCGNTPIR